MEISLRELKEMLSTESAPSTEQNHGNCIVVLDRGFVYYGELITDNKFMTINKAKNVRTWGTTKGLGQLATQGPQENTKLDNAGTVKALLPELKHFLVCESSW